MIDCEHQNPKEMLKNKCKLMQKCAVFTSIPQINIIKQLCLKSLLTFVLISFYKI